MSISQLTNSELEHLISHSISIKKAWSTDAGYWFKIPILKKYIIVIFIYAMNNSLCTSKETTSWTDHEHDFPEKIYKNKSIHGNWHVSAWRSRANAWPSRYSTWS